MSSVATVSVPPVAAAAVKQMPAQIGKYRILGRLGDGATSEVFLGFDDFQGRNVAIKRVRTSTAADPIDGHYSERFFAAEAALVGKLQHPNVVQIFDAVPDPAEPYLVMEYGATGSGTASKIWTTFGCCKRPTSAASAAKKRSE